MTEYCCERFEQAVREGYIYERIAGDVTEYYIDRIVSETGERYGQIQIFYCPFCPKGELS